MKRPGKKLLAIGVLGMMLIAAGCNSSSNPAGGEDTEYRKPELAGYQIIDPCGESHSRVVSVSGCQINIQNSILAGVNADSFKVRMDVDGTNVDIYEQIFQSEFSDSLCYYTFSIDINTFGNGTYSINVFKQVNGGLASFEWSHNATVSDCNPE